MPSLWRHLHGVVLKQLLTVNIDQFDAPYWNLIFFSDLTNFACSFPAQLRFIVPGIPLVGEIGNYQLNGLSNRD